MKKHDLIILGAGLSGLSTAMHYKGDYLILEKDERPGGLTRTEDIEGFLFNHTGHWLHLRDPRVTKLVNDLLPGQMVTVERKAAVYSNGVFTLYPFQANLYGLPKEVLRECLQGAVSAAIKRASGDYDQPANFLEYAKLHFGEGIARHFIVPYNTKLWGVSPAEVTAEWTQRFVPIPDIGQIVDGALGMSKEAMGYNASFLYPAEGGIETLAKAMFDRLDQDKARMNSAPESLSVNGGFITLNDQKLLFDKLVSSLALPDLVNLTVDAPDRIRKASALLRCSPLRYVNVALDVPTPLHGNHWIYLPESKYPFYRVGSASNAVPALAPPEKSSLYVELANDSIASKDDIISSLTEFLIETGSIQSAKQVLFTAFREHPWGYVIFDDNCANARQEIIDFYADKGVLSIGRYGGWTYNSMEDAIIDGINAASRI